MGSFIGGIHTVTVHKAFIQNPRYEMKNFCKRRLLHSFQAWEFHQLDVIINLICCYLCDVIKVQLYLLRFPSLIYFAFFPFFLLFCIRQYPFEVVFSINIFCKLKCVDLVLLFQSGKHLKRELKH